MIRRNAIKKLDPIMTNKKGRIITAQAIDDVLILNIFYNKVLKAKYFFNCTSNIFGSYIVADDSWNNKKLCNTLEEETWRYSYNGIHSYDYKFNSNDDMDFTEKMISSIKTDAHRYAYDTVLEYLEKIEEYTSFDRRKNAEERRIDRLNAFMATIPPVPDDLMPWMYDRTAAGRYYAIKASDTDWNVSCCRSKISTKSLLKSSGLKKLTDGCICKCPKCGKDIRISTRRKKIEQKGYVMLLQNIDKDNAVARHFGYYMVMDSEGVKQQLYENVRVILYRNNKRYWCRCYYSQGVDCYDKHRTSDFFDLHNPGNRHTFSCYLYPDGINDAMQGTYYEPYSRIFQLMAKDGFETHYNALMRRIDVSGLVEYLYKGRFYRIIQDNAFHYWMSRDDIWGSLYINDDINDVFKLTDTQKINRLRQCNGGNTMLEWLRNSEAHNEKYPDEFLNWVQDANIRTDDLDMVYKHNMNAVRTMNYIEKQRCSSYKGRSVKNILEQYNDYLSMCEKLEKDLDDEMVYRPKDLKLRHDEAVEETNAKAMILEMKRNKKAAKEAADALRAKFPHAEETLKRIRPLLEYSGERYMIIVPDSLTDITLEGNALHHCVGASDRYFDRIEQNETYIVFLRKTEQPEIPYYTVEVEPGGTIRQHRSMYDEEPCIDEIRPFLTEWQKVIRKRMSDEDKKNAGISRNKRIENIEDLRKKQNTRVLKGLAEDFMDADLLEMMMN